MNDHAVPLYLPDIIDSLAADMMLLSEATASDKARSEARENASDTLKAMRLATDRLRSVCLMECNTAAKAFGTQADPENPTRAELWFGAKATVWSALADGLARLGDDALQNLALLPGAGED